MLSSGALTGSLIYLNTVTENDINHILTWSDIDYMRYLARGLPNLPLEKGLRDWMLEADPDPRFPRPYAIRTLNSDHFIGVCGYKELNWPARNSLVWIGIGALAMRGKGYGSDAMRVLLRYAFTEMNLNRVGLEVGGFNDAAIRTYEKVGFQVEGKIRQFMYREGRYWDMHLMGILREEWEASR